MSVEVTKEHPFSELIKELVITDSNGHIAPEFLNLSYATKNNPGTVALADSNGINLGTNTQNAVTPQLLRYALNTLVVHATPSQYGTVQIQDSNGAVVGTDDTKVMTANKVKIWGVSKTATETETRLGTESAKFTTPSDLAGLFNSLCDNINVLGLGRAITNLEIAHAIVNGLLDRFVDNSGINTGGSTNLIFDSVNHCLNTLPPPSTSYANAGGTGDRTASITITGSPSLDAGTFSNLVDGAFANNSTDSISYNPASHTNGATITVDFGTAKYINEITHRTLVSGVGGTWKWQCSTDNISYVDASAIWTWDSITKVITLTPPLVSGYRYYKLVNQTVGNALPWITEFEFKLDVGAVASNMTVISNSYTANAVPNIARVLVLSEPVDAITLNTDLVAYVSRDNGTTYTAATLTKVATILGKDILVATVNISGQTSGSTMLWKLVTSNSKSQKIHGITVNW